MKSCTTARACVAVFVSAAFLWLLVLGVSPQLHSRLHSDANLVEHTCAVTLTTSGNYTHSPPALVISVPIAFSKFSEIPVLNPVWVQSLFFGAHIFAHAPPALLLIR
jgi:hypothetical protein